MLGFEDDLGPKRVIHVHEPGLGLSGVLVVDNVAAGPSIGGLRMAEDVTVNECFRLARAMTLKNAAAGLPHGGGKSVLRANPKMLREDKESLIRAFACALRDVEDYIFGPDMGTDEVCMAWVKDEIGRSVGLPREVGGIPLDELGATGFGVVHAIEAALPEMKFELSGARVAVQGFGAVGLHAARFLAEKGAVLVAASDSRGAVLNDRGLDVAALIAAKRGGAPVAEFDGGTPVAKEAVIGVECEIWIPSARPDVIDMNNVEQMNTKLVAQGANIPITQKAEQRLHEKGVLILPDFIANAGGVICAAMEYRGAGEKAAFDAIAQKIRRNVEELLTRAKNGGVTPRRAAVDMAQDRVRAAMKTRRWSIY
ncbi:MAG: Glu/Leu/Phe/Val dehydrogenase [Rhodospirillaceae bacterium]|nr:Glu/Leu/Phe/Val dehydrogenase [Rhodospirillaceae bacterium]MBT5667329.1 Glu/Leu/Phe/Val dehydrogenase [Rhodospirillaceae bacterium]